MKITAHLFPLLTMLALPGVTVRESDYPDVKIVCLRETDFSPRPEIKGASLGVIDIGGGSALQMTIKSDMRSGHFDKVPISIKLEKDSDPLECLLDGQLKKGLKVQQPMFNISNEPGYLHPCGDPNKYGVQLTCGKKEDLTDPVCP